MIVVLKSVLKYVFYGKARDSRPIWISLRNRGDIGGENGRFFFLVREVSR